MTNTEQMWAIKEFEKVVLPSERHGIFYSGESYIIHYKYTVKWKEQHMIYFWQGRDSSIVSPSIEVLTVKY